MDGAQVLTCTDSALGSSSGRAAKLLRWLLKSVDATECKLLQKLRAPHTGARAPKHDWFVLSAAGQTSLADIANRVTITEFNKAQRRLEWESAARTTRERLLRRGFTECPTCHAPLQRSPQSSPGAAELLREPSSGMLLCHCAHERPPIL